MGVLAALAYLPLILAKAGTASVDTKAYLYLDPSRLLAQAPWMWSPQAGFGTVTHQTIGYLFPMGPFFWLAEAAGLPDWFAQRLWMGTILFAAGLGVRHLLRTLEWSGAGPWVASLAYMLSPYALHYAAKHSVILLPWAALPWLLALAISSARHRTWRHPALFAIVVTLVGGVNATALLFVGLAPVMWLVWAAWGSREVAVQHAVGAAARIGVLTLAVSLWWIAGLWAQGSYGIDVLRFTESAETVSLTSTPPEILRGLGYWFFYGTEKVGPFVGDPGSDYTQHLWLIAVSFAVPALALVGAALGRWRHRPFFAALLVTGLFLSVGAHPWDAPPPAGAVYRGFLDSDVGLAMRSTPRAAPLLILATSVFLGAGVTALSAPSNRRRVAAATVSGVLVLAALGPALVTGDFVADGLSRPNEVPDYWLAAADHLDGARTDTRVLEVPGADFAAYRWGTTIDPITPGLMGRPYVARELVPFGSEASVDLLNALDRRLQEGIVEPGAIAPIARLMNVGDLVVRSDLAFERYRTPRPRTLWAALSRAPGLGEPTGFGGADPNVPDPRFPLLDEHALGTDLALPDPPAVATFPVQGRMGLVTVHPLDATVVVAGSGEGLVDMAAAGLIDGTEMILYAADLAGDPRLVDRVLDRRPPLVITDTNRRLGRRWGTVHENLGYTEPAGEEPVRHDPTDNRIDLFPDAGDDHRTVAVHRGGVTARATSYGNPISFSPEDRPAHAVDGDARTAWRTAAGADPRGESLVVDLTEPVRSDRITLLQPQTGVRNRWLTRVRIAIHDGTTVEVDLTDQSRTAPGQVVTFPEQAVAGATITLLDDDIGKRPRYQGVGPVGFATVRIADATLDEVIRVPDALLDAAGPASHEHDLTYVLTRRRADPAELVRSDEELAITRSFRVPTNRAFTFVGGARINDDAPDATIDGWLRTDRAEVTSSGHLDGAVHQRAAAAIDGDPATWWSPPFLEQRGHHFSATYPDPVARDALDLVLVADGMHSVPTRLILDVDGQSQEIDVPPVEDQDRPGATTAVEVPIEPVRGRTFTLTVADVREQRTVEWHSEAVVTMPVGVAEMGLPSVDQGRERIGTRCRSGLLSVDGEDVPLEVKGTVADAEARDGLDVRTCDGRPLVLAPGSHVIRAAPGIDTGLDLDRITLRSAPGGDPGPGRGPVVADETSGPVVTADRTSRTGFDIEVRDADGPFWLTLGESHNPGWAIDAGDALVGRRVIAGGFANGWLVDPASDGVTIDLTWTPQRVVWAAIVLSGLAVLAVAVLAVRSAASVADARTIERSRPPLPLERTHLSRYEGDGPGARQSAGVAVATAAAGVALIGPLSGLVCGAAVYAVLRRGRLRPILLAASPGLLALSGLYTVAQQYRHRFPAGIDWPEQFSRVHEVAWLAVAMLAIDVIASRVHSGRWGASWVEQD